MNLTAFEKYVTTKIPNVRVTRHDDSLIFNIGGESVHVFSTGVVVSDSVIKYSFIALVENFEQMTNILREAIEEALEADN